MSILTAENNSPTPIFLHFGNAHVIIRMKLSEATSNFFIIHIIH